MLSLSLRRLARRLPTVGDKVGPAARSKAASSPKNAVAPATQAEEWEEVVDKATGQSYWWNKKTNETTPLGYAKPGPDPWKEVKDGNGQIYWWNQQTNQTTGVGQPKPSALAPAPGAEVGQPATAGGGLMGAVADGMAMGVGMSVASRMMDGIMGPRSMEVVHRDETGGGAGAGDAGGGAAAPPPPGSDGDMGSGGDLGSEGWGWGEPSQGGGSGGGESGGGESGGGDGGWFGGGDGDW